MHNKFEINRTKIKGGCQSGRKVVTLNSKRDLPLETSSSPLVTEMCGFLTSHLVFGSCNKYLQAALPTGRGPKNISINLSSFYNSYLHLVTKWMVAPTMKLRDRAKQYGFVMGYYYLYYIEQ